MINKINNVNSVGGGNTSVNDFNDSIARLRNSEVVKKINAIEARARNDMQEISDLGRENLMESNVRSLIQANISLYEMTVRYDIFAKAASKGMQGFESLLRTQ